MLQNTFPEKKKLKITHTYNKSCFLSLLIFEGQDFTFRKESTSQRYCCFIKNPAIISVYCKLTFYVLFLEKKLRRLDSHIQINFERFQEHCFLLALYANSVNKHLFAILSMHTRSGRLGSITLSVDVKKIPQDFASFILQHWIKNMFIPFAITFSCGTFCTVANG